MKKIVVLVLWVAMLACVLMAQASNISGKSHTSFTEVFQPVGQGFRTFAIANTGAADLWVRFAYGSPEISSLSTDSVPVPAGMSWTPPANGDLGKVAHGYWLSSAGTEAVTAYD